MTIILRPKIFHTTDKLVCFLTTDYADSTDFSLKVTGPVLCLTFDTLRLRPAPFDYGSLRHPSFNLLQEPGLNRKPTPVTTQKRIREIRVIRGQKKETKSPRSAGAVAEFALQFLTYDATYLSGLFINRKDRRDRKEGLEEVMAK